MTAVRDARETDGAALDPDAMVALRALAEPSRARVIARLAHGEHCVCDLGDALGLSPALISHHLKVLREAGLIGERRSGRWVYYSLELHALTRLRASLDGLLNPADVDEAGERVTVTRDGRPVAELRPVRSRGVAAAALLDR